MANELHAHATTGLTVYGVLLNSTGQVWTGAAFAALAGATWTDCDIAMTEAGTKGIYLATMPTSIAGAYSYYAYKQAGVSPATTDTLIGTGWLKWNGTAEIYEATIAISAAEAEAVSSGSLALRTYYTFSQAITSTTTAALDTATKVWLAIKHYTADADTVSIVFVEKTDGLTYLAQAAYTTVANGTLVITGSIGAWTITVKVEEAATALLGDWTTDTLVAEVKALIAGDTITVWDGTAKISPGIVRAYV